MKRSLKKRRLKLCILISCTVSAALTYSILSHAAAMGKKLSLSRRYENAYAGYSLTGYSYDTVSEKRNILIGVCDGSDLKRLSLFTSDCDKKTLDVLEIPPCTRFKTDGFDGLVLDAYKLPCFKELISRMLGIELDGVVIAKKEALEHIVTKLGGVSVKTDETATIGELTIGKGKRRISGSVAGVIVSDDRAYTAKDSVREGLYTELQRSVITALSEKGAISWFPELMDIILNETDTDITVEEMIDTVNLWNKISIKNISFWMLPGEADNDKYIADIKKTSELLNDRFRVKGRSKSISEIGF